MEQTSGPTFHFRVVPFDDAALQAHREWLDRLATGEREAMRLLYHELAPLVHGVVRRILEDPEDAREVVQDVFIKAWRQAGTYRRERGEVVSWLVLIARNAAIDRVRRGARRRLLHEVLAREAVAVGGAGTSAEAGGDTALDYERASLLGDHLAQLSTAQRRALELAFFAGCSQGEIAAHMQTPVGNVKNHLRRGLARLRQMMGSR